MKITNHYGYPSMFELLMRQDMVKTPEGTIRVTELIGPPLIRHLRQIHWDNLTMDVSEWINMFLGTLVHKAIASAIKIGDVEMTLTVPMPKGYQLVGTPDWVIDNNLFDWKTVGCIFSEVKQEWTDQLNVYAWMRRKCFGQNISKMFVTQIHRDWSKMLADKRRGELPTLTMPVPLWTEAEQDAFVSEQFAMHTSADVPACTDEDRWYKGKGWAVINSKGTCTKVCEHHAQAQAMMKKNYRLEQRNGEPNRCIYYCNVRNFCPIMNTNLIERSA